MLEALSESFTLIKKRYRQLYYVVIYVKKMSSDIAFDIWRLDYGGKPFDVTKHPWLQIAKEAAMMGRPYIK